MRVSPGKSLRKLLERKQTLVKPGAYNALSALIIEKAGFPCCGVTGYGVSASLLGKPDVGLVTLDEIVMINRTGVSPRLPVSRLNELGIAIVSNATGSLRSSTVAMCDYFQEFARDDVEAVKRFEARVKDHPAGNMHTFIGFSEIKRLEEEFLPSAEVLAKYEGAVGFQP